MKAFIILSLYVIAHVIQPATTDKPNQVTNVHFIEQQNTARHRTSRYRGLFVLRRGELLDLNIHFGRQYNKTYDRTRLEFCFGDNPTLADKSLIYVPIVPNRVPPHGWANSTDKWDSQVLADNGQVLNVQVAMPASIPVGKWSLRISTKLDNTTILQTYLIRQPFYILFNPWSPNDQVYLDDESSRQEYIMNEMGIIYQGTYMAVSASRWNYAQFDQSVLPTVMWLLDKLKMTTAERADAVKVSRAVSAISNSNDEGGLVEGKWKDGYAGGVSPWAWSDSASIFRKFIQNGYRPVKYGQCWVFGGVTTTVLRSIGIPARSITNFQSAHDTDKSLTVDKFFSERGAPLDGINGDSTWNFHVWSEAWMSRSDLPSGYDGWQAIDATPQEKSMDKYQMGPTSLEAVKQGKIDYAYDGMFVFSEVNAAVVHWHLDGRVRFGWRKTRSQPGHGRKILTKRVGSNEPENIIDQYKHREGSIESREVCRLAVAAGGLQTLLNC